MADGTVRGAYELNAEQPIRQLRSIRDAGAAADVSLRTLGDTMDGFASPTRIERLNMVQSRISNIGSAARDSVGEVELLDTRLDDLSRKRATPKIDLAGVAETNAALSEIEARLDRLDHRRVSPNVSSTGGLGGLGGGGGGGFPSQTPFGALGGFGGMALGALGLSPGIMGLLGGATSLVGSAGAGLLGAGAVGLGGAGELAVGAGVALVAKQAATGIQAITKAQTAYNTAVQTYGRNSAQAATDAKKLHDAMIQNAGAAVAARQVTLLQSDFRSATAPARAQIYRGVGNVAYSLRGAIPALAPDLTMAAGATAGAAGSYARFITGQQSLAGIGQLSQGFATDLPIAERSLQNITQTFGQLAVAAIPFFHEANVWVMNWTHGMATSTQDTARVQGVMQRLVTSAKDWADLTGSAYHLMRDIFSAAAPSGDSMVVQLTHTLDRWDTWIRDNPQKVQTFFTDARHTTEEVASGVSHLASDFAKIAQLLGPIFDRALQVLNLFTGLGPGGMSLVGGLLFGGYRGLRGAMPGLPTAGGLAGSFILGSGGPAARSMGGAEIGAAGLVAGAGGRALTAEEARMAAIASRLNPGSLTGLPGAQLTKLSSTSEAQMMLEAEAAQGGGMAALAGGFGALKGGLAGAARFALPIAGITALMQGLSTPGGFGAKSNAAAGSLLNMATFGALPHGTVSQLAPFVRNAAIGGAILGPVGILGGALATPLLSPATTGLNLGDFRTSQGRTLAQLGSEAAAVRTPGQLHDVMVQARVHVSALDMSTADKQKLQAYLNQVVGVASHNAGSAAASSWEDALTTGIQRQGPNKAVDQALSGMLRQVHDLGPKGGKAFAGDIAQWVAEQERAYPKMRGPLEKLMQGIIEDLNRLQHHTGTSFQDLQSKVFFFNGQIYTGTTSTWKGIWGSLTNQGDVAKEKLLGIFGTIQAEAINALTAMGFSKANATSIVHQTAAGGAGRTAAGAAVATQGSQPVPGGYNPASFQAGGPNPQGLGGSGAGHERGGVIRGQGLLDTVPTPDGGRAAPGEAWIANRHTMHKLDLASIAKWGKTAWQMIEGESTPHSSPTRQLGGAIRYYTTGGPTGPVAGALAGSFRGSGGGYIYPFVGNTTIGRTDQGVDANMPVGSPIGPMGASVVRGVVPNWYHGQPLVYWQLLNGPRAGQYAYVAEQITGIAPVGTHLAANQAVARYAASGTGIEYGWAAPGGQTLAQATTGYTEGQVTPAGSDMRAFLAGLSHGQILSGGGGFGAGAFAPPPQVHLRSPRSGMTGVPGALVDRGAQIYTHGLQQMINRRIGAMGGGGGAGFHGSLTGPVEHQVAQFMSAAGFDKIAIAGMLGNAMEESQMNPNTPGGGLWQQISNFGGGTGGSLLAQMQRMLPQIAGLRSAMNTAGSPGAAATIFEQGFERAGVPALATRIAAANAAYAAGYQTGRAPVRWGGWHAGGLDAVTSGPTLFGAGEGPKPERVRISPAAQPTASPTRSGHQITFHPGSIVVHGGGDPNKIAEAVAEKLIDALDGVDHGASDDQLLGAGG